MKAIIRPLNPDLIFDWLDFFDNRAFTDNPFWKSCYCTHQASRIVYRVSIPDTPYYECIDP
ncbi:MAG: hypothetical protein ISS17_03550 [Bacteroidales bacterium]|nr:hypothetical protein [Bacteroidales bacterium]